MKEICNVLLTTSDFVAIEHLLGVLAFVSENLLDEKLKWLSKYELISFVVNMSK